MLRIVFGCVRTHLMLSMIHWKLNCEQFLRQLFRLCFSKCSHISGNSFIFGKLKFGSPRGVSNVRGSIDGAQHHDVEADNEHYLLVWILGFRKKMKNYAF